MRIQDVISRFVPLNELKTDKLLALARQAEAPKFDRGALVFDFGDTSPYSYYLVQGALILTTPDRAELVVKADDAQAAYPIGNLLPRQLRARVGSQSAQLLKIARSDLEWELSRQGLNNRDSGLAVQELDALPTDQQEWTLALLNTPLFSLLPKPHVRALLRAFEGIPYHKGDVVIREGDPAGYFYLLLSGSCSVTRRAPTGNIEINRIHAPDGFGEEALVTGEPRGATITMLSDGVLLRIGHLLFYEHMLKPLVRHTPVDAGRRLAEAGKALIIDVRDEESFAGHHLPRAHHIPMYMLYLKSKAFNSRFHYLIHGDNEKRSQAAAFLLARRGLRATILGSGGKAAPGAIDDAMILPGAAGA